MNTFPVQCSPISAQENESPLKAGNERTKTSVTLYQCTAWSLSIETDFANSLWTFYIKLSFRFSSTINSRGENRLGCCQSHWFSHHDLSLQSPPWERHHKLKGGESEIQLFANTEQSMSGLSFKCHTTQLETASLSAMLFVVFANW